ncbi:hypothetical protein NKJ71_12835 [Mesorhizobium sp. M0050]|uniref:hypothetical protein n=1 Tax=unclassified Mesorhizobium TaxID=325217 RepID=UPI00333732F8
MQSPMIPAPPPISLTRQCERPTRKAISADEISEGVGSVFEIILEAMQSREGGTTG